MTRSSAILLAIDTSTRSVGVALYDGEKILNETTWNSADYHTVELAPAVEQAFQRVNLDPDTLSALAVAIGPGSFTGLRIGLAFAKGFALTRHLPILGVPTLEILAYAQPLSDASLATVLRAGRGRLAVGWFENQRKSWRLSKDIEVCTPTELGSKISKPTIICGELSDVERDLLRQVSPYVSLASPAQSLRRTGYLAELAWKRWKSGNTDDPASLSPIYLHYNEPIPG